MQRPPDSGQRCKLRLPSPRPSRCPEGPFGQGNRARHWRPHLTGGSTAGDTVHCLATGQDWPAGLPRLCRGSPSLPVTAHSTCFLWPRSGRRRPPADGRSPVGTRCWSRHQVGQSHLRHGQSGQRCGHLHTGCGLCQGLCPGCGEGHSLRLLQGTWAAAPTGKGGTTHVPRQVEGHAAWPTPGVSSAMSRSKGTAAAWRDLVLSESQTQGHSV